MNIAVPSRRARASVVVATTALGLLVAGLLSGVSPAHAAPAPVPSGTRATLGQPTAPGPDGVPGTDDRLPAHTSLSRLAQTSAAPAQGVQDVAAHQLAGRVTDQDGAGVGTAKIWAERIDGTGLIDEATALSAADGTYSFDGLTAGDYLIVFVDTSGALATELWQDASPYRTEATTVSVDSTSALTGIDAQLAPAGRILGTVSGTWLHANDFASGRVAAHLLVQEAGEWVYAGYDVGLAADGSYLFDDLYPDTYRVQVIYAGPLGYSQFDSASFTVAGGDQTGNAQLDTPWYQGGVDFSGDGYSDVLAIASTGKLLQYRGDGSGRFAGSATIGSGWNGFAKVLSVADFSGDGNSDLLATDTSGGLWLYRGNGTGGFSGSGKKIGTGWSGFDRVFSPGDFDGDGHDDVIARTPAGKLFLYRGNGTGGWAAAGRQIGSGWSGFTTIIPVGDFDGDGTADVLARNAAGKLFLYGGDGAGGWLGWAQIGSGWNGFNAIIGAGDFDWDGAADVLARDSTGKLWLYPGNGAGGWLARKQVGTGWSSLKLIG